MSTNICCPNYSPRGILVSTERGSIVIKEYLTTAEAAEYSGVSASKLAKLRHNGTGCRYVRIGDSKTKAVIRYKRSDLDDWMSQNMIKTFGGA